MFAWIYGLYLIAKVKAAAVLTKQAWDLKCIWKLSMAFFVLLVPGSLIMVLLYGLTIKIIKKSAQVSEMATDKSNITQEDL